MHKIYLHRGRDLFVLPVRDLAVCERKERVTLVYHRYGVLTVREKLGEILAQEEGLVQCHRSFLLAPERIWRLGRLDCDIRLFDGRMMTVPLTPAGYARLESLLKIDHTY